VHDPSILKADGWYYIYGSHMTAAKAGIDELADDLHRRPRGLHAVGTFRIR
jgi:hypothetical protein